VRIFLSRTATTGQDSSAFSHGILKVPWTTAQVLVYIKALMPFFWQASMMFLVPSTLTPLKFFLRGFSGRRAHGVHYHIWLNSLEDFEMEEMPVVSPS
jgi:hypothetical protein